MSHGAKPVCITRYGKFLVAGIPLKSLWTPVLYTNTFSIVPALLVGCIAGEFRQERLAAIEFDATACIWLAISSVIGICISWAGFWCQSLVTATTYSVVGVMNKMLTVTVNILIWDQHASTMGISSLAVCLFGGTLYQQAPLRKVGVDDEMQALSMVDETSGSDTHEELEPKNKCVEEAMRKH